jgi:hypothetical protein
MLITRLFFLFFQVSEVKRRIYSIEDCEFDVSIELFASQPPYCQLPGDIGPASPLCKQQFTLLILYRQCFWNIKVVPHTNEEHGLRVFENRVLWG